MTTDLPATLRRIADVLHVAEAREAADEIERLQSIVESLPKCWTLRDGKPVQDKPVTPGMMVFARGRYGVVPGIVGNGPITLTGGIVECIGDCYDSREAAEASR